MIHQGMKNMETKKAKLLVIATALNMMILLNNLMLQYIRTNDYVSAEQRDIIDHRQNNKPLSKLHYSSYKGLGSAIY